MSVKKPITRKTIERGTLSDTKPARDIEMGWVIPAKVYIKLETTPSLSDGMVL